MTRQGPPELPGHSTVPSLLMEILENQQCQDGSVDLYSPFNQANPLFKGSPVSQGFLIIIFIIAMDGWKMICVCRRESWAARLRCIVPDIQYGNGSRYAENDLVLRHGKGVSGKTLSVLVFHYVAPEKSCGSSLFHCFRPKAFQHSWALNSVQSILHGDRTARPYFMYNMKESMTKSLKNLPPLYYLHCSVWVWSSMGYRLYLYHVAHL